LRRMVSHDKPAMKPQRLLEQCQSSGQAAPRYRGSARRAGRQAPPAWASVGRWRAVGESGHRWAPAEPPGMLGPVERTGSNVAIIEAWYVVADTIRQVWRRIGQRVPGAYVDAGGSPAPTACRSRRQPQRSATVRRVARVEGRADDRRVDGLAAGSAARGRRTASIGAGEIRLRAERRGQDDDDQHALHAARRPPAGRPSTFDVVHQRAEVRRSIGLVFKQPTLDEYLSAEQNPALPCLRLRRPGRHSRAADGRAAADGRPATGKERPDVLGRHEAPARDRARLLHHPSAASTSPPWASTRRRGAISGTTCSRCVSARV
jgi:hypothetical protein